MLVDAIFSHAKTRGDELAIIDDRGRYTWRQLAAATAGLGMFLQAQTKRPGVGLLLPASGGFVASFYGAMMAGKHAVPINFLLADKDIAHIIQDSGVDTILSVPPLAGRLANFPGLNVIDLSTLPQPDGSEIDLEGARLAIPKVSGDDLATILYTSGTSALPKGVRLTYNNVARDIESAVTHAKLEGRHRFLGIIPLFHSTGMLATMAAPIELGATIVYIARFSPVATAKAIREHKISVMAAVPSMYGALIRLKDPKPEDFSSMWAAISGGEPLPEGVRNGFKQRFGIDLYEGYGLTETCGPVCVNTPLEHRPGSVGRLIPGAEARFVDDNDKDVKPNDIGEIWLRGPMIMQGYHNKPDATRDVITPDGFFKTGDLGRIDSDGYLWITGRKKEMIIVAGEKAFPREIEDVIMRHPSVLDAAVLGKKDESRGEAVVAFVIPKEGQTVVVDELRDFCRDQGLAQWKCPRDVRVVDDLPRSPTGKVLKRVLAEQLNQA